MGKRLGNEDSIGCVIIQSRSQVARGLCAGMGK